MAKLNKHAASLHQLMAMVKKAESGDKVIGAHPEIKPMINSNEAESTKQKEIDQNAVKAENNGPQGIDQKPGKAAAELKTMSDDIFAALKSAGEDKSAAENKTAEGTKVIGAHPEIKSMINSDNAESTKQKEIDQNAVKAENNTPQGIDQKPGKAAAETDAAKIASYSYGRRVAAALFATFNKQASAEDNVELLKMAGKRDMENIIAAAVEELGKTKQASEKISDVEAEKLGAEYFDKVKAQADADMKKEAESADVIKDLNAKIAALEARVEGGTKVAAEVKEKLDNKEKLAQDAEKEAELVNKIAGLVIKALKDEPAK